MMDDPFTQAEHDMAANGLSGLVALMLLVIVAAGCAVALCGFVVGMFVWLFSLL